jgi:hypothetical protein
MTEQSDPAEGRISTELRDGLFLIGIDRPAKLNGFTPVMLRSMAQAYTRYEREPEALCAVVFAEGANFTAGLDLPKVAPHLGGNTLLVEEGEIDPFELRPPFRSKPVIFAVHGICFTLGIEMMLAADIVVAASNTRFAQVEVKRGLMPTGAGPTKRKGDRTGEEHCRPGAPGGCRDPAECACRAARGCDHGRGPVRRDPDAPFGFGRFPGGPAQFQGQAHAEIPRELACAGPGFIVQAQVAVREFFSAR